MIVFRSPSPWLLPSGKLNVDWSRAPRGLAACFAGGNYVDIAQNKVLNFYNFGTRGSSPVPTPRGMAFGLVPSGDYGGSRLEFNPNGGASCEVLFLYTGSAAQGFVNFFNNATNTGGQGASAVPALGVSATGKLILYLNSSFVSFSGATTLVAGNVYHAAATWDGSGNCTLYLNGKSDGTSTGTIQSNPAPASFNMAGTGYSGDMLSPIILAACAGVQWTADEVQQRFIDPFGFLTAEGEWPALFVAGGGGGSFLAAWAKGSNLPVIGTGTY